MKVTKEDVYNEVVKILVSKYGVDEDLLTNDATLGDDLNLGTPEIQDFLLDISDKYQFEYEDLIDSIKDEIDELEELTVAEVVAYIYDALKFDWYMELLESLNQELNFNLQNLDLFLTAFTHRSYLNEHPKYPNPSNERLEFLGDAVLQFLSSKHLYYKFSGLPEGDLTNLRASIVKTTSLAEEAKKLNFGQYLLLSKGEEVTGGRDREYLLANTFEAFLGALYIEKGMDACDAFLEKNLFYKLAGSVNSQNFKDAKTKFQEKVQEIYKSTPSYKISDAWGSEHEKTFKVGVYINNELFTEGEGPSKQKAEQDAATKGLDKLK